MEEWQHLSNGVQMQGPVTCSLRPGEISNECDGGEILYPKLGCLIQGSNTTKHVFHTLSRETTAGSSTASAIQCSPCRTSS